MSNDENISKVIENAVKVLSDYSQEIHWDEYWDTLYTLGPDHVECAPVLILGLDAETSFAKLYCLDAIERIGYDCANLVDKLIGLTKDADYKVRCKAVDMLFKHTPHNFRLRAALLDAAKRRGEYLRLRCKAVFLLCKLAKSA